MYQSAFAESQPVRMKNVIYYFHLKLVSYSKLHLVRV